MYYFLPSLLLFTMVDIFMSEGFINPFGKGRLKRRSGRRTYCNHQNISTLDLDPTFNASFFPSLWKMSYKHTDELSSESYEVFSLKYPWLARITTSVLDTDATLCPAACIRPLVFLAAARCVIGLTVGVFGISFENKFFESKAIVFPDEEHRSKQYFDDFGFVVIAKHLKSASTWPQVALFDEMNRTDDTFQWFAKLCYEDQEIQHKLLAFSFDSYLNKNITSGEKFPDFLPSKLYMHDVVVGIHFCQRIFTRNHFIKGYFVPCAFVCTEAEFKKDEKLNPKCAMQVHQVGSIIINTKTNKLLGVTTWSALDMNDDLNGDKGFKLPVGIAIANSENFFKDLECAEKVSEAENEKNVSGYYQELCSPSKKILRKFEHKQKSDRHHHSYYEDTYSYSDSDSESLD